MSMNKQQTAVEWSVEKLASLTFDYMAGFISKREYEELSKGVIRQAKEMEKEQHEKTYLHGFMDDDYVSFDNYWKHEYEGEKGHHKGIFGYLTYAGNK